MRIGRPAEKEFTDSLPHTFIRCSYTVVAMIKPERSGVIYSISCNVNGKVYIGSTMRRPNQRRLEHLHNLRHGKHHSKYLQHCFNKHGEASLSFKVIERVEDANFLLAREQFQIWRVAGRCLNSAEVADSHLAAAAVNTGRAQSAEERAMRSQAQRAATAAGTKKPREWTDKQRAEHSIILTGRTMPEVTETTRANISKAKKGCVCPPLAIERSVATRTAFIADEIPTWLKMRTGGMSFREIERRTGRSRRIIARECSRVSNEARTHEALARQALPIK